MTETGADEKAVRIVITAEALQRAFAETGAVGFSAVWENLLAHIEKPEARFERMKAAWDKDMSR